MGAVFAWAGLIVDRHLDMIYPLLLPLAVLAAFSVALRWRVCDWRSFIISGLTIGYGAYVVSVLLAAVFLAWQFSGGGGPLVPVYALLLPVSSALGALGFWIWIRRSATVVE